MVNQKHHGHGDNVNVEGDAHFYAIQKYPSILAEIINELGKCLFLPEQGESDLQGEFVIADKIKHNNIVKYKGVIEEHRIYQGKLNAIYGELDSQASSKKLILLRNVRNSYLKIKGSYIAKSPTTNLIDTIRTNSDKIIEDIEKELLGEIDKSNNIAAPLETVKIALLIIMVDAFMRCKILENPEDE